MRRYNDLHYHVYVPPGISAKEGGKGGKATDLQPIWTAPSKQPSKPATGAAGVVGTSGGRGGGVGAGLGAILRLHPLCSVDLADVVQWGEEQVEVWDLGMAADEALQLYDALVAGARCAAAGAGAGVIAAGGGAVLPGEEGESGAFWPAQ